MSPPSTIQAIDKSSVHRITSGQVVIDLQTAVKELVENSLDAGATSIEVRFRNYGLKSVEVIDNGSGIAEKDHAGIGLKHHTSKLSTYSDLSTVTTFGFRGEALSSLCALCESVSVTTATAPPMGVTLDLERTGKIRKTTKAARQRGTTITLNNLFHTLPVRRKEFERNLKREYGKALNLLNAYALVPCSSASGVRLTVSNQTEKSPKNVQLRTQGVPSLRASVEAVWGPKSLENIVDLNVTFSVDRDTSTFKRIKGAFEPNEEAVTVTVKGLISKFSPGCGRTGTDRQYLFINGRPCNLNKVQKVFNETYRSYNATQSPLIIADFIIPTDSLDVNVSPDKRTIFLHSESNFLNSFKTALDTEYASTRSTFEVNTTQTTLSKSINITNHVSPPNPKADAAESENSEEEEETIQEQPTVEVISLPPRNVVASQTIDTALDSEDVDMADPMTDDLPADSGNANVVLDTTQASWSRIVTPVKRARTPDEDEGEEEDAPLSKRVKQVIAGGVIYNSSVVPVPPPRRVRAPPLPPKEPSMQTTLSQFVRGDFTQGTIAELSQAVSRQSNRSQDKASSVAMEQVHESDEEPEIMEEEEAEDAQVLQPESTSSIPGLSDFAGTSSSNPATEPLFLGDDDLMDLPEIDSQLETDEEGVESSSLVRDFPLSAPDSSEVAEHPEIVRSEKTGEVRMRFDIDSVCARWKQLRLSPSPSKLVDEEREGISADAGLEAKQENAAAALSRVIEKRDFRDMNIVGQFNLGFIIARKTTEDAEGILDDLFIVDQHASDEKYNFETLIATTVMDSQRLFKPEVLELSAADNFVAKENIDILRKNGFEISVETEVEDEDEENACLKLTAKPVSKSTVFGMRDLEELIGLLRDRSDGQMVRCSKARAMFASRACRKSVMIGMPLNKGQMKTVVQHMGTIEQPWNCPHGRPTMRHLFDLNASSKPADRRVDWLPFS